MTKLPAEISVRIGRVVSPDPVSPAELQAAIASAIEGGLRGVQTPLGADAGPVASIAEGVASRSLLAIGAATRGG
ncbi:MAG TPA: hypothetical protein VNX29_04025 [Kaistia sp.]|nr:hypothetical protein [Kaistia sp.]